MGYVPYVGFMTHRHATVRTCLCLYKKIKKKGRHKTITSIFGAVAGDCLTVALLCFKD
jgi:hypothetical protein